MSDGYQILRAGDGPGLALDARWLFVSPHDDDVLLGAGLLMQAVREAHVVIVSDGRMGYADPAERDSIVQRRKSEAERAYRGITGGLHFMGFPDGSLHLHAGSRLDGDKPAGLENALTALLRAIRPDCVITTDSADWHPDHRTTFEATRMALFHAAGDIWGELGPPLGLPAFYTYPVYAPLAAGPDFCVVAPRGAAQRRADALACFSSQADVIARLGARGDRDFVRRVAVGGYDYSHLFH